MVKLPVVPFAAERVRECKCYTGDNEVVKTDTLRLVRRKQLKFIKGEAAKWY